MAKKLIRLTENDLHRIVKESVKRVITEVRSGDWDQYRLKDFAHKVLGGIVWGKGIIKSFTGEIYKYKMKGRLLKIDFSQYSDGGPGWAEDFINTRAQDFPEYQFSLDPMDENKNTILVRCKYDEYWGH